MDIWIWIWIWRTYGSIRTSMMFLHFSTSRALTLLFDPNHALDERIAMEQFVS